MLLLIVLMLMACGLLAGELRARLANSSEQQGIGGLIADCWLRLSPVPGFFRERTAALRLDARRGANYSPNAHFLDAQVAVRRVFTNTGVVNNSARRRYYAACGRRVVGTARCAGLSAPGPNNADGELIVCRWGIAMGVCLLRGSTDFIHISLRKSVVHNS